MRKRIAFRAAILFVLTLLTLVSSLRIQGTLGGRVLSDGVPIADAVVRVKATEIETRTDATGHFVLSGFRTAKSLAVTAWKDGYHINGLKVYPWTNEIVIELRSYMQPDNVEYQWVPPAVTGRSTFEEKIIQASLSLAARLSYDSVFIPLVEQIELGCQDCHRDTINPQWAASAHALGNANQRFLSLYNGTDLLGSQSPLTRHTLVQDYGQVPLPPDEDEPYYGEGYLLDFPDSFGNCSTCHLPTAALADPYGIDPNQVEGVDAQGVHCDFCHKINSAILDSQTGLPFQNMTGILSYNLLRPDPEPQLFFGPFDDVDVGPDTYLPLTQKSEFCAPCHNASFWDVPIYESYAEWLASPYPDEGQTCQSCHMRPDGQMTNFAPGRGGVERDPQSLPTHLFPGSQDEILLQSAATLEVEAQRQGEQIIVDAGVTNTGAGHHLPTDSPLRQVFLIVKAIDKDGNPLQLEEGPSLPDWAGDLKGLPGVYFAKILEQMWTNVSPTAAYWTPTKIVEDTRLPAGETMATRYIFSATDGEVAIRAELIFRRAYFELMQQKGWDTPDMLMKYMTLTVP